VFSIQPRGDNGRDEELGPRKLDVLCISESRQTCEPLVLGPALAIDKSPGRLCLSLKFSSTGAVENDQKERIRTGRTGEHLPVDGFSTSAVVMSEVSALEHELRICRKLKVRQ